MFNGNVLIEIGAAFVLYDKRVVSFGTSAFRSRLT